MIKKLYILIIFLILNLLIVFSDVAKEGASRGIIISSNVIIPSLFPFIVCIVMTIKCGITINNKKLNYILYKIFGYNSDMFFAFIFSMLGGYPIGAKIINELYDQKNIDDKTANIMLMYCVNAGPAFVVSVVGGILGSKKIGFVLLISHLLSSIIIALFCANKIKKHNNIKNISIRKKTTISKLLVDSVNDALKSIINICGFIILFSVIASYFDYFFNNMPIINNASYFLEITTALHNTKDIYLISFLLGFSGISIWFQIIAMFKNLKINYFNFVIGRILHGTISVIISKIIFSIFKINITTFNNNQNYIYSNLYSDVTLLLSMLIMFIVFMIFIYTKNNSGKIINDMI